MGCIGSRLAIVRNRSLTGSYRNNSRRQNIFPVLNVDDMGRQISPGKLEVTETDLVLHVRGKPSLTWPLRCLRRYGYDNDLFSFESGRRCPTGAGIFAFRCNRAQSMFNLLQSKIQGNPGTTPNTVPSTPITPNNTGSNNPATPVSSTFVYVNLAENSSNRQTTNAPDVTQVSNCALLNQTVPCSLNSMVNSCGSSFPLPQSYKQSYQLDNSHPVYMNVESTGNASSQSCGSLSNYQNQTNIPRYRGTNPIGPVTGATATGCSSSTFYQNPAQKFQYQKSLDGYPYGSGFQTSKNNEADSLLYTNVICSPNSDRSFQFGSINSPTATEPAEVNYAELDLKTEDCSSSSTNPTSTTTKGKFSLLNNKENNWPNGSDSKFKLKFGKSNSSCAGVGINLVSGGELIGKKDLTGENSLNSPTGSTNYGELGYATIDFDRTAALGVVTRSKINLDFNSSSITDEHDVSARKTRHNSTAL